MIFSRKTKMKPLNTQPCTDDSNKTKKIFRTIEKLHQGESIFVYLFIISIISSKLLPFVSGKSVITNTTPANATAANRNQHPNMPIVAAMIGNVFTMINARPHKATIHIVDPMALA